MPKEKRSRKEDLGHAGAASHTRALRLRVGWWNLPGRNHAAGSDHMLGLEFVPSPSVSWEATGGFNTETASYISPLTTQRIGTATETSRQGDRLRLARKHSQDSRATRTTRLDVSPFFFASAKESQRRHECKITPRAGDTGNRSIWSDGAGITRTAKQKPMVRNAKPAERRCCRWSRVGRTAKRGPGW